MSTPPTHLQLCCCSDFPCSLNLASILTLPTTFGGSPAPSDKTMPKPLSEALHDPGTAGFPPSCPISPQHTLNSSHAQMLTVPQTCAFSFLSLCPHWNASPCFFTHPSKLTFFPFWTIPPRCSLMTSLRACIMLLLN